MQYHKLLTLPNLLTLIRILLAPAVAYFIWRADTGATVLAAVLFILAGITDGLDGYLARRLNCETRLGVALDPIADKVFAIVLVGALILWRGFPVWLAGVIVGRDLILLGGGTILMRRFPGISLPSNLTGKWAFAAVAVLLGAHIIRFEFSIQLMTPVVVTLLAASLLSYGQVFRAVYHRREVEPFRDRPAYRAIRIGLTCAAALAHVVMFWVEFLR